MPSCWRRGGGWEGSGRQRQPEWLEALGQGKGRVTRDGWGGVDSGDAGREHGEEGYCPLPRGPAAGGEGRMKLRG